MNNKSYNKKNTAKKSRRGLKIFIVILSLLAVGILATSVTFNVLLARKVQDNPSVDNINNPSGDHVIVTPEPSASLLSIDPGEAIVAASNTVNVPVSVTPDVEDENLEISWTIRFAAPASDWATGKNVLTYASVSPTYNGSCNANITIRQAFGEQIIVTASVVNKTEVNASCTVDYVCKYDVQGFEFTEVESEYNDCAMSITPIYTKSAGTIDEEITQSISMKASDNFVSFLDDVINRPLIKAVYDGYTNLIGGHIESGSDSLVPKIYGFYSDYDSNKYVSFNALTGDNYKLHTERLLMYFAINDNPDLWNTPLATFSERYGANRFDKADDCNKLFNSNVKAIFENPVGYGDPPEGSGLPSDLFPIFKFGLEKAKVWTGSNSFMTCFKLPDAFTVTCTITSEHNNVTFEQSIPFLFNYIPSAVSDLEIDPPTIIV